MSEFTDDTLGRYLNQQPGMREALLHDPVQHQQAEQLRQTLAAVERAMADEHVPDEARRRVINRVVWGEPEGLVDVHARMYESRLAARQSIDLAEVWKAIHDGAPPVRPDEETTTDERCPALNPFSHQCKLTTGHDGLHQSPGEEPT